MEDEVRPVTSPHAFLPSRLAAPVSAWAWLVAVAALFALYLLTQDNGMVLGSAAEYVHAFTHDARHAFGVPCH